MQRKQVIFVADSLDNAHKFQQVLSSLDVDVAAGSSAQFRSCSGAIPHAISSYTRRVAAPRRTWPASRRCCSRTERHRSWSSWGRPARALSSACAGEERLRDAKRLARGVRGAHPPAAVARQRGRHVRLPRRGEHDGEPATWVTVAGEPFDLTYPEYALLAFLVTHPRARTGDALPRCVASPIRRSRTVIHVRVSARSWAPNWLSTWKPSAASATSGAHRSSSPPPAQTSQQEPPPPR
ncbi:MAG: hypothetical protein ACLTMP_13360 [Eggerthella lenta]